MAIHVPGRLQDPALKRYPGSEATLLREIGAALGGYDRDHPQARLIRANLAQFRWVQALG